MRKVPDIVAVEINRLRKLDIAISDDDVVWLSCLGYLVESPNGQTLEASGIADGVLLSNEIVLKPLTVQASKWLKKYGGVNFRVDDTLVVAYAMANSDDLTFDKRISKVVKAVRKWTSSLKITLGEIEVAVARMLANDTPEKPGGKILSTEEVIALLVAATGLSIEYWNAQTWEHVNDVYSGVVKYASMLSPLGGNPDAEASKAALKNFALAIQEISNRGNKING